jgi:hypothetical protein
VNRERSIRGIEDSRNIVLKLVISTFIDINILGAKPKNHRISGCCIGDLAVPIGPTFCHPVVIIVVAGPKWPAINLEVEESPSLFFES